jgi:hypothetical protein
VNLPGCHVQIDTVERDGIAETFRDPTSPHRNGAACEVFRLHTRTLRDGTNGCVDGD